MAGAEGGRGGHVRRTGSFHYSRFVCVSPRVAGEWTVSGCGRMYRSLCKKLRCQFQVGRQISQVITAQLRAEGFKYIIANGADSASVNQSEMLQRALC